MIHNLAAPQFGAVYTRHTVGDNEFWYGLSGEGVHEEVVTKSDITRDLEKNGGQTYALNANRAVFNVGLPILARLEDHPLVVTGIDQEELTGKNDIEKSAQVKKWFDSVKLEGDPLISMESRVSLTPVSFDTFM